MENTIQPGTQIFYTANGVNTGNIVIRVESDNCIVKVPTIGGTWKEKIIHISQISSFVNRTNC